MKKNRGVVFVFFVACFIYFAVGTRFTFHSRWTIDYFNLTAQSILHGRLDLPNPPQTYDLVYFQGKWYTVWGVLPAIFLIPFQLLKGQYIPPIYLSIFFSGLNISLLFLILQRIKKEYFPGLRKVDIYVLTAFYAFGTAQFYVGTLGSSWHVSQIVSSFFGNLGVYIILKKKRSYRDYFLSVFACSVALLGRLTSAFLVTLPLFLYVRDRDIKRLLFILSPLIFFLIIFFWYNLARFGNPLDFGYAYIHEAPYLEAIRLRNGASSLANVPSNLWYMLLEIPSITYSQQFEFHFNLIGNSIFFLSPPLLAIFLASPLIPIVLGMWVTVVVALIPVLLHYSTGWMQFGYRYTLDVTMLLVILSLFGMKGKLNLLYYGGIIISIILYSWGIVALQ